MAERTDGVSDLAVLTPDELDRISRPAHTPRKSGTQDNRTRNRALVLRLLYREGPLSRSELVRRSGLTAPTISALVADLQQSGLVRDAGLPPQARIGKPAPLVELNASGNAVVVLDIAPHEAFSAALVDLSGTVLQRTQRAVDGATGAEALQNVLDLAEQMCRTATVPVLGVGIAAPGLVDQAGHIRFAAHLDWHDVDLAGAVRARTGLPTVVGNDTNLAALGVRRFRDPNDDDLIVVSIEHGVGAGVLINGAVVEGEQFAAGELGHVTADPDGGLCSCGRRGCLDLVASAPHLRRLLKRASAARRTATLEAAGAALGRTLAPVLAVLNINTVVLLGPADLIDGPLLAAAERTAKQCVLPALAPSLTVRSRAGDDDLGLLGAAALVLTSQLGLGSPR
ncbi:ROK family protein [Nakamurella aerolata]|uniref:ROK family transcriptional regulator n=1 Tax=Nakamurella aerolata TaxID=1656892 RepID=A0A849ADJ4_9ACTN|nr:ROK family transcriptional regulator [Nakamurella aerolata]